MGKPATPAYEAGLTRLSEHAYAYMQPDGGWGWSNAGLLAGGGDALLVDTLFDLKLTRRMLDAMQPITGGAIGRLVNTHYNGDHCFGNQLLPDAEIIAHRTCPEDLLRVPPQAIAAMAEAWGDSPEGRYIREFFQPFDFNGITLSPPTTLFDERMSLELNGHEVELILLGPAHTRGDIIVHFPREGVVYTGDLLFHLCTPLIWEGTCEQWVHALDTIMDLNAEHIVPGHGPLADTAGVQLQKDYLLHLWERSKDLFEQGVPVLDAISRIDLGPYADWGESERVAANVMRFYQLHAGETEVVVDYQTVFHQMARIYYGAGG